MLLLKKVFIHLLILLLISCEAGLLYFFGNKILMPYMKVDSGNSYLFRSTLAECLEIALFVCAFIFLAYLLTMAFVKKKTMANKLKVSIGCFAVVLFYLMTSTPWGFPSIDLYVGKNLLSFAIAAVSIPFFQKVIIQKHN